MKSKTPKMLLVEEKTGKDIKDLLYELYVDKDLTLREMVEYFKNDVGVDITVVCLHYWLKKFGIPARMWRVEK